MLRATWTKLSLRRVQYRTDHTWRSAVLAFKLTPCLLLFRLSVHHSCFGVHLCTPFCTLHTYSFQAAFTVFPRFQGMQAPPPLACPSPSYVPVPSARDMLHVGSFEPMIGGNGLNERSGGHK